MVMKLLIVGAGSMGRWFASSVDAEITFLDVRSEIAQIAANEMGAKMSEIDTVELFDVVCIAVPIPNVVEAISTYSKNATEVICDITGVMKTPIEAMKQYGNDIGRMSLHPLFGPENYPGRIASVMDENRPMAKKIIEDLEGAGNTLFTTTAEEHDEVMRTVQGMAHAAILSFALASQEVPNEFGTPIFDGLRELVKDMTNGNARVYSDIQEVFGGSTEIMKAAEKISSSNWEEFKRIYDEARG
tara:strand:- start:839 stop:1570 length:732 start_codon:yes stop_codon:yes gene_type:complete